MPPPLTLEALNALTSAIIDSSIRIHRALGPGLLESAYLGCLCYELHSKRLVFELQKPIPLVYEGVKIDCAYRADLIVSGAVLVEVKAMDAIAPIHLRQVYTYLSLADLPVGLLLNFGAIVMKSGIKRVANGFPPRETS